MVGKDSAYFSALSDTIYSFILCWMNEIWNSRKRSRENLIVFVRFINTPTKLAGKEARVNSNDSRGKWGKIHVHQKGVIVWYPLNDLQIQFQVHHEVVQGCFGRFQNWSGKDISNIFIDFYTIMCLFTNKQSRILISLENMVLVVEHWTQKFVVLWTQ